ncbi:MAG: phospholipid-binding domain-containing protein [Rhodospirillaceae bacterium]|nr:phospholipid-binding domain-containing protein [Rhodospirillaceae bacterium]
MSLNSLYKKGELLFSCLTIITVSILLSSCSPVGLVVGAGASLMTASQTEKGLKVSAKDLQIKAEINHNLFQKDHELFGAVKVSVDNGKVLITGSVPNPQDRIEISRLSWKVGGVREVINEVQVTNKASFTNRAKDLLINKSLQTQLLLDQSINFINFSVDTVNGVVYIFGIARDQEEINRVIKHARNINYVENIINYMSLGNQ